MPRCQLACAVLLLAAPAAAEEWRDPGQRYQDAAQSLARGEVEAARQALAALAQLGYTPPGFWTLYGLAQLLAQDPGARASFARAAHADPKDGAARFYLGLLALDAGDAEAAIAFLQAAQDLLAPEDPLFDQAALLLAQLAPPAPPFAAAISAATQADSNALLTPDAGASEAAGARALLDAQALYQRPLGEVLRAEVGVRLGAALPFVNAEALAPLDPLGGGGSFSLQARVRPGLLLAASGFGAGLRRDFGRAPFAQSLGGAATLQAGEQTALRVSYRAAYDNFGFDPEGEGSAFDQDGLSHDLSLSVQRGGLRAGAAYSQTEADGNNFDRRSAGLLLGYKRGGRVSLDLAVQGTGLDFPNGLAPRQDLRLSTGARAGVSAGPGQVFLAYTGLVNRSSQDDFSFTRHLVSLGYAWETSTRRSQP